MIRQLCFVTAALISTLTAFGSTIAIMSTNSAPAQIASVEHRANV